MSQQGQGAAPQAKIAKTKISKQASRAHTATEGQHRQRQARPTPGPADGRRAACVQALAAGSRALTATATPVILQEGKDLPAKLECPRHAARTVTSASRCCRGPPAC